MNNLEMIDDIFDRTKLITKSIIPGVDNPQITSVMNYLIATTVYLKGREEAKKFKEKWEEIKGNIEKGIGELIFSEYLWIINSNLKNIVKREDVNDSNLASEWLISPGIDYFYQNTFLRMYGEAKMKQDNFNKNFGDKRREHYEYIFSTKERWEEALRRGDPAAICD
jgi:hypothetical protein